MAITAHTYCVLKRMDWFNRANPRFMVNYYLTYINNTLIVKARWKLGFEQLITSNIRIVEA